MPRFRILYLAAEKAEKVRHRAPAKPPYRLRRSHYEEGPELEAPSPYALWRSLREQDGAGDIEGPRPLEVGDALQTEDESLLLCNYWGFDPAEWRDASDPGEQPDGSARPAGPSEGVALPAAE